MCGLYRDRYADFTVKHFHEALVREHHYKLCYTVTRLALQSAGLVAKATLRGKHRKKRERRPLPGMLLFHREAIRRRQARPRRARRLDALLAARYHRAAGPDRHVG